MILRPVRAALFGAVALTVAAGACSPAAEDAAPAELSTQVPSFEVDTTWPRLPANWVLASGLGLFVDAQDRVWVSHRAELVTPEALAAAAEQPAVPAPIVLELDLDGNVIQSWGPQEEWDEWPAVLHGFFVDHNGFIWSNARDQHQIMKFTRDGERVLTIGRENETGGSNNTELLGRPSDVYVDPASNELVVVDGYTNRRVIVFDAETGAYRRHWGAYGEVPVDPPAGGRGGGGGGGGGGGAAGTDAPPPAPQTAPAEAAPATPPAPPSQFSTVHGITGSTDGLLYVADRQNSRVQVFRLDGTYVTERILRDGGGAAFAVALSHDPAQDFLYVADGTEHKVWILRRNDLQIVGEFGSEGAGPGQFQRPHNLAVDSQGNLYVGEADPGWRVQKFNFRGLVGTP